MLEPEEVKRWERLTRAMLSHAADDDPAAFAQVVKVLDDARAQLPQVAAKLRGDLDEKPALGGTYSWGMIAQALGVTRSAAYQRFGRRRDRLEHSTDR